jgi:hypothetical protein
MRSVFSADHTARRARPEGARKLSPGFTLGELPPTAISPEGAAWYGENRLQIGPPTHFYAFSPFRAKHVLLANPG